MDGRLIIQPTALFSRAYRAAIGSGGGACQGMAPSAVVPPTYPHQVARIETNNDIEVVRRSSMKVYIVACWVCGKGNP